MKDKRAIRKRQRKTLGSKAPNVSQVNRDIREQEWVELTSKLKAEHILFCEKFVETRDYAKAYSTAYPKVKPNSAHSAGNRLLNKPEIIDYINMLIREYGPVPRLSMNEIMVELEHVAMNPNIESPQKLKALTILGQAYGELTEKHEVTTREFVIDIIDEDED